MIRLKQVTMVNGETTLVFEADGFPEGVRQIQIPLGEIVDRLKIVKEVLGRPLTLEDAKNAVITVVNKLRSERQPLTERFNWADYVGVDLER